MNTNIIEELSFASRNTKTERLFSYPYNYQPLEKGAAAPHFSLQRHCGLLGDEFNHSFRNEAFFHCTTF